MNNVVTHPIVLSCSKVSKVFGDGPHRVDVLKDLDFTVQAGETIAILGVSGSGKSTLLHVLGGLDQPTSGDVMLMGRSVHQLTETQRCEWRNRYLGFVYQFHHLMAEFTVLENVCMPMLIKGTPVAQAKQKALRLLDAVGLSERAEHKPSELSGGERQRTAIIRALVNHPKCILADEPTGNLDPATAEKVYDVMLMLNRELSTSIVIVTHDLTLARRMDRMMLLHEGRLYPYTDNQRP